MRQTQNLLGRCKTMSSIASQLDFLCIFLLKITHPGIIPDQSISSLPSVTSFYAFVFVPLLYLGIKNDPVLWIVCFLFPKGIAISTVSAQLLSCHQLSASHLCDFGQIHNAVLFCWQSTLSSPVSCGMKQQHTLASHSAGKPVLITMETNRKWGCEICLQVW